MIRLKITVLVLINALLSPIYSAFLIFAFCASFLPLYSTVTAKRNLKDRLGITGIKSNFYITLLYLNYLFYFIEAYFFDFFSLNHCFMVKDSPKLDELYAELNKVYPKTNQTNFIFILSHMANIEMYAFPVVRAMRKNKDLKEKKLYALAKPSRVYFVNKLLEWYRHRSNLGIIWTNKNFLHKMNHVIDSGNPLCLLADQKPKSEGLFLNFFGKYAVFPISGLRFCMNKNMIVIYASAYRILPGWMELKLQTGKNVHFPDQKKSEMKYIKNCDLSASEIHNQNQIPEKNKAVSLEMSYFASWIEKEIRQNPTQWSWDYRKWSRDVK